MWALLIIFALKWAHEFYKDWRKDQREDQADRAQIEVLNRMDNKMGQLRDGQLAQNGKLALVAEKVVGVASVNEAYHGELLSGLRQVCEGYNHLPCRMPYAAVMQQVLTKEEVEDK